MNHVFASRLTKLRMKAGMSQKELALTLKIGAGSMSNYENGIYLPPLEKACVLAQELHTSLDYLTGLSDIHLDPELFSRPVTEKFTFYHIIKLLASLENKELADIAKYAEFLKYKRTRGTYVEAPKAYLVAEDAKSDFPQTE